MTRQVPLDKPLSDQDREYLHMRGEHDRVASLDEQFGTVGGEPLSEGDDVAPYEEWTVKELDEELAARQLPKTGKQEEKVARLRADDASRL
jgi:hypothetical protein